MERETVKGIAAGVLAGAAVGAGLALLFGSESGPKSMKDIMKRADELKVRADNIIANVKERDEAFCKAVKESADNYRKEMLAKIS